MFSGKTSFLRKAKRYHTLRRIIQFTALALFLYLFIGTQPGVKNILPQDLFFLVDPLAGIAAMLASREWLAQMALGSGMLLLLTIVLGRAWCGWLCPLGTLLDFTPTPRVNREKPEIHKTLRQVKNGLSLAVISGAALGSLTLIVLDPITILFRSLAGVISPVFNWLAQGIQQGLFQIEPLQPAVAWFDISVRAAVFGNQSFHPANITVIILFVAVLAVNIIRPRFWCRYLCPLGALLGFVSRINLIRHQVDDKTCVKCGRCLKVCPMGAVEREQKFAASTEDCVTCLECVETCPSQAISFRARWRVSAPAYQSSRRQFLAAGSLAILGALLLRFQPFISRAKSVFIRPPGATEQSLETQCVRCGECVKVCPTVSIQPISSPDEFDNIWTPHLLMRRGYCDYSCNACGQVCPTGAISSLELAVKREVKIGVAIIDKNRCLPFAEKRECIVCEEMCPLPEKAIYLGKGEGKGSGQQHGNQENDNEIMKPHVIPELCIGCGICEYQCPVAGVAAIRVFPLE